MVRRERRLLLLAGVAATCFSLNACSDGDESKALLSADAPSLAPEADLLDPIDEVSSEHFVFATEVEGRRPVIHDQFTGPTSIETIDVADAGVIAVVINCTPEDEYRIEVSGSASTWGTCAPDGGTAALIPVANSDATVNGPTTLDVSIAIGDETTYWFIAVPGQL